MIASAMEMETQTGDRAVESGSSLPTWKDCEANLNSFRDGYSDRIRACSRNLLLILRKLSEIHRRTELDIREACLDDLEILYLGDQTIGRKGRALKRGLRGAIAADPAFAGILPEVDEMFRAMKAKVVLDRKLEAHTPGTAIKVRVKEGVRSLSAEEVKGLVKRCEAKYLACWRVAVNLSAGLSIDRGAERTRKPAVYSIKEPSFRQITAKGGDDF